MLDVCLVSVYFLAGGKLSSRHSQASNSTVGSDERVPSGTVCSHKQKSKDVLKQKITLCEDSEKQETTPMLRSHPGRRTKRSQPVAIITSVQLPPPKGRETLIGSMEVKCTDLLKDLQRRTMKQRYTSYPFPFYSQGHQYQLLLYPSTLRSSAHCTLYLVMLKHRDFVFSQLTGKVGILLFWHYFLNILFGNV